MDPKDTKNLTVCEVAARACLKRALGYVDKGEYDEASKSFKRAAAWSNRARIIVDERKGGKLI